MLNGLFMSVSKTGKSGGGPQLAKNAHNFNSARFIQSRAGARAAHIFPSQLSQLSRVNNK